MFKLNEIKELIKLVDQTSVHELDIEIEGTKLSIRKPGKTEVINFQPTLPQTLMQAPQGQVVQQYNQAPVASEPEVDLAASSLHKIVSPMVGTFYRASSPDKAPFISVGDRVDEKSTVCIIEAMKLMNELEAEIKGEIVEVLAENGQLVEFGQPLFLVKAD
ncbi:acetyl-CoA carboxylase biotin carboxyl carrier protein [Paenibacillus pini]|uniref:Biotin carboxyl carrier protein of acetyl-CoA carboxylase n=1 Tax=Paenibacillus pini JCM 16418 TaxID=1236976 RepID=W7YDD5_9BACL|nr:acetyl-CoA carboxylase biotin carboxyl carrier protein [Paenibacillus pini]GAF08935.1 biotin carboxyl carrier protein of acetyl-CoA carboxylase [Paenibacillus pini JCM 16418]